MAGVALHHHYKKRGANAQSGGLVSVCSEKYGEIKLWGENEEVRRCCLIFGINYRRNQGYCGHILSQCGGHPPPNSQRTRTAVEFELRDYVLESCH